MIYVRLLVGAILTAVAAGGFVYALIAAAEGQWGHALMGGIAVVVPGLVIAMISDVVMRGIDGKRRDEVISQRMLAPAVVTDMTRGRAVGEDMDAYIYRITATVYPPDMPPYTTSFEEPIEPALNWARWEVGKIFRAQLVNANTGEIEYDADLDESVIPLDPPAPLPWETVRAQYIDGSAAPYQGVEMPHPYKSNPWRTVQTPAAPREHPLGTPMFWLGRLAGAVIVVLVCMGSITNTIERVQLGELSTTTIYSSVIARDGAQTVLDHAGGDEFFSIHLYRDTVTADVQRSGSSKVETWRLARDGAILPGTFVPFHDMTLRDANDVLDVQAFTIDDVKWENLPDVSDDAREMCQRDNEGELESESVRIAYFEGQLEFRYQASFSTTQSCDLRYSMDGKPVGR